MVRFGFIDVPGGTDGPNFGPIPIPTLERKVLKGDTGAVLELRPGDLERLIERTRQQAVAAIILDVGEDALVERLMQKYHQGHFGEKWLEELREKLMRERVKKLRKTARF